MKNEIKLFCKYIHAYVRKFVNFSKEKTNAKMCENRFHAKLRVEKNYLVTLQTKRERSRLEMATIENANRRIYSKVRDEKIPNRKKKNEIRRFSLGKLTESISLS